MKSASGKRLLDRLSRAIAAHPLGKIRFLVIVGYGFGIRSERRLCEEVHLNLA
jgi:hypothetical protein